MTHEQDQARHEEKIIIHSLQTVLLLDRPCGSPRYFGWLPNLFSNKWQEVTVMRVWVLILKLSQRLSTAVYSPSGINDTLPRVI
jgi:hypothetical protein